MPPTNTYDVTIELTTIAHVTVNAESEDAAVRAVQDDLDNGNEVLCDDIVRIENEVPHCAAKAIAAAQKVSYQANSYFVDGKGKLRQITDAT